MNTRNSTKITLHKYVFGCRTASPLFAYAYYLSCLQSLKNFLAMSNILVVLETNVVTKMWMS